MIKNLLLLTMLFAGNSSEIENHVSLVSSEYDSSDDEDELDRELNSPMSPVFYPEQEDASRNIIKNFRRHKYQILLAQMQAGKTGTYMRTIFEMILTEKIKNAIIISGNREKELRQQCKDDLNNYITRYSWRYQTKYPNKEKVVEMLRNSIKIYWGQDLVSNKTVKAPKVENDTLIVWDESHFAQSGDITDENSKLQAPCKYFKDNNLGSCLSGDFTNLEERNIYILSVSATPFSELINNLPDKIKESNERLSKEAISKNIENFREIQEKNIVRLKVSNKYRSLKWFNENGLIKDSENIPTLEGKKFMTNILLEHINKDDTNYKYYIIRINGDKSYEAIQSICKKIREEQNITIDIKEYWSDKDTLSSEYNKGLDRLAETPINPTVILLKGMCRMGKVLIKKNVGFVYESAQSIKTDTCLQGLPGRLCGYPNSKDRFEDTKPTIYVSDKVSENIERYIESFELEGNAKVVCSDSMNVCKSKSIKKCGDGYPCIPILIKQTNSNDEDYVPIPEDRNEERAFAKLVLEKLKKDDYSKIKETQKECQTKEVINNIDRHISQAEPECSVHTLKKDNHKENYKSLISTYTNKEHRFTGFGKAKVDNFDIVYVTEDRDDISKKGDIWMLFKTRTKPKQFQSSSTTKNEAFYPRLS